MFKVVDIHDTRKSIWKYSLIFWLLIAVMYFFQDILTTRNAGFVNDIPFTIILASIAWIVWACITPVVVFLAQKYVIQKNRIFNTILIHIGFSILIVSIHMGIQTLLIKSCMMLFFPLKSPERYLPSYFLINLHTHFIVYFFIGGVTQAINYFILYRTKEIETARLQAQLITAQLQTLKMQLHPHFLFNTHHAIISLMIKGENQQAIQMLTKLSELLRMTLDLSDKHFVSLKTEMEITNKYLEIIQTRFHDRLKINTHIEAEIVSMQVPAFIIQPLVENAVNHGFSASIEAGIIEIKAYKHNDRIRIEVRDDGKGLKNNLTETTSGLGIKNIVERLKQLFGENYLFELKNHPDKGVLSIIEIPV